MNNVTKCLQMLMDDNCLTNYKLSKKTGIHQTTIANILSGHEPQEATLIRLADFFDVDALELRKGNIKKKKPVDYEANELFKEDIIKCIDSGKFSQEQLQDILFSVVEAMK